MNNFFAMKPSSPRPKVLRTAISTILAKLQRVQVSLDGTNLLQTHVAAQSRIKAISSNCGVRIKHSRCCWLEGAKPNIVVTKSDVTTRIFTYNGGLIWFTETVQIVPKTRKTLQTHFSDRKSTRLNSSHITRSRMPSSA